VCWAGAGNILSYGAAHIVANNGAYVRVTNGPTNCINDIPEHKSNACANGAADKRPNVCAK
jgi:hypothetical protein